MVTLATVIFTLTTVIFTLMTLDGVVYTLRALQLVWQNNNAVSTTVNIIIAR